MAYDQTRTLGELGQNTTVTGSGLVQAVNSPAQFDSSASYATTAFVKQAGLEWSGFTTFTSSQTLSASQANSIINCSGTGSFTLTMPTVASTPVGSTFTFISSSTGTVTINAAGSDSFSGQASITLNNADTLIVTNAGGGIWWRMAGSQQLSANGTFGQFGASLATPGWQKLPSGLIIQWGNSGSVGTSNPNATAVYPIAFPAATLNVSATVTGGSLGNFITQVITSTTTQTTFNTQLNGSITGGIGFSWIAIGR